MPYQLTDSVHVFTRADWGARLPRPMSSQGPPAEAFLHHTASSAAEAIDTLAKQKAAVRAIQAFHMDGNRWSDIGYHYLVFQPTPDAPARIFEGRLVHYMPAAQLGHNRGTFAVAVVGNFEHDDQVQRNTRYAIEMLLTQKPELTGAGHVKTLGGHRDVCGTDCPGDTLYAQLDRIVDAANLERYRKS